MQRIKTRAQFQAVLAGDTVSRVPHFALHRLATPVDEALFVSASLYLGALLPKRWAKRAVTRNLLRRQIYSVASLHARALARVPYVVRLRRGFDAAAFVSASSAPLRQAVRAELVQLFGHVQPMKALPREA
ncbi:MAG: ribonuclease P protein component [Burkholderiales bacterium]